MTKQTIGAGTFGERDPKINSNFTELYSQAPPDADRAFSHTYIAMGDEVATPTLVANTPTKYQLPITAKGLSNFEIAEISTGVYALKYIGTRDITCVLNATTSILAGANNTTVKLMMYKNGVYEVGSIVARKIGTGADLGAMGLSTSIQMVTNDYFDVYVESDVSTTITFLYTNIVISEVHQD